MTDYKFDTPITKEQAEEIGRNFLEERFGWKGSIKLEELKGLKYCGNTVSLFKVMEIQNGEWFRGSKAVVISGVNGKIFAEDEELDGVMQYPTQSMTFQSTFIRLTNKTNKSDKYAVYKMTAEPLFEGWYEKITPIYEAARFIAEKDGGLCNVFDFRGRQKFKKWFREIEWISGGKYIATVDNREGLKNIIKEGMDNPLLDKNYRKIDIKKDFREIGILQFICCEDEYGKDTLYKPDFTKIDTGEHNSLNIYMRLTGIDSVWNFEDPTTNTWNILEESDNTMVFKKWVDEIDTAATGDKHFTVKRDGRYNIVNIDTYQVGIGSKKKYHPMIKEGDPWFTDIAAIYLDEELGLIENADRLIAVKRDDGKCTLLKGGDVLIDPRPYIDWVDDILVSDENIIALIENDTMFLLVSNWKYKNYIECDDFFPGYKTSDTIVVCIEKGGKYNFVKTPGPKTEKVGEMPDIWFDAVDGGDTIFPVVWKDGKCNIIDTTPDGHCEILSPNKWFDDIEVYDENKHDEIFTVVEDGVRKTYSYNDLHENI